jgi:integrase
LATTGANVATEPRTTRLLQRTIDALTPTPGARYVVWDTEVTGFGVRVSAGAKTYIFKYRLPTGRVRWAKIARVDALGVDKARKRAYSMRGQVSEGKDPLREIDTAKAAVTVADAAARFLQEHGPRRKPSTRRMYEATIEKHIRPRLGAMPIGDVSTEDATRLHHRLRATPCHANRVLAVLSKLLAWSMKARLRPAGPNPCYGIEKYPERKRKRYLTADEYARLGKALRAATRETTIGPAPLTAIQLLLLTGARPIEIATLQWSFVDLPGAALRLPDSKTGEKTIHLSPAAARVLKRWPRWASSPYVFPGTRRGADKGSHIHGTTLAHAWATLRTTAGLDDVRLYDACRHSFASVAVSQHDLSLAQIGEQLGHSQPATTARYAHLHDTVAKRNATAIGGSIAEALKRRPRR